MALAVYSMAAPTAATGIHSQEAAMSGTIDIGTAIAMTNGLVGSHWKMERGMRRTMKARST
jgi:hypothetical protein